MPQTKNRFRSDLVRDAVGIGGFCSMLYGLAKINPDHAFLIGGAIAFVLAIWKTSRG